MQAFDFHKQKPIEAPHGKWIIWPCLTNKLKTMKTIKSLCFSILVLVGLNAQAQEGLYFQVQTGYALQAAGGNIPGFGNVSFDEQSYTEEQIKLSLGNGFNFGIAGGYMFNEHVGLEVGINQLFGAETTAKWTGEDEFWGDTYSFEDSYTLSSSITRILPALILRQEAGNVQIYTKLGASIGFGSITSTAKSKSLYNGLPDGDMEEELILNGGVCLGFNGAFGVIIPVADQLYLTTEVQLLTSSYAPTKGEYTKYIVDGEDLLSEIPEEERTFDIVDEVNYDSDNGDMLRIDVPMSSVGINIGLIYAL
jgi:opacity protein-like surface antigen